MMIDLPQLRPGAAGRDRGSLSLFIAIIAMVVVVFFAVIVDFSAKLQARHDANIAAEEAARAAAGQIDQDHAYTRGSFIIDRQAAIRSASHYLKASGITGSATAVSTHRVRVPVTISRPAIFLPVIGISTLHVDAVAIADLATGITREDR